MKGSNGRACLIRACVLRLALACLLFAANSSAHAQEPSEYKATIASAIQEFDHENFTEARELFERAHSLFPNARTLRGLGVTAFELRNYVEAVTLLEQALDSDVKRLDGALRGETEQLLQRARKYVGSLRLQVMPTTFTVAVDGVVAEYGSSNELVLGVGDHVLEFRAAGHLSERRSVRVKGEQTQTLKLSLSVLSGEQVTSAPTREPEVDRGPSTPVYKRWWLWTTVGVVVAGAAVGTALWLKSDARSEHHAVTTANTPAGLELQPLLRIR